MPQAPQDAPFDEVFLDTFSILYWQINQDGILTQLKGKLCQDFQLEQAHWIGQNTTELSAFPTWLGSAEMLKQAKQKGKIANFIVYNHKLCCLQIQYQTERQALLGFLQIWQAKNAAPLPSPDNEGENYDESYLKNLLYQIQDLPVSAALVQLSGTADIIAVSNLWASTFRTSPESIIGTRFTDLFIDPNDYVQAKRRARRKNVAKSYEARFWRADENGNSPDKRKVIWCSLHLHMFQIGEKRFLFVSLWDISSYRQNEEKYRSLIRYAPDYILHIDLEGEILYLNRSIERYSISELMGKNVYDFLSLGEQVQVKAIIEEVLQSKSVGRYDKKFYLDNEDWRWVSMRIAPMYTDEEVTGFAVIATDITKNKLQEAELHASESKNAALLNALPDTILLLSREGIVLDYRRATNLHLQNKGEYDLKLKVGDDIRSALRPVYSSKMVTALQKTFLTGRVQTFEDEQFDEKTQQFYFLETRLAVSSLHEVLVVVRNITEQKKNEREVNQSRQEYKRLLDNIDEIVYHFSIKEVDKFGELLFVSNHLSKVLGYLKDDFKFPKFSWIRLIHPADRRSAMEAVQKAIYYQENVVHRYRIKHKTEGSYIWLEARLIPQLDNLGRLVSVMGVARDITREVVTEQDKKRFISLVRSNHDCICMTDPKGDIIFINQAGCELLGIASHHEVLGKSILDFYARLQREQIQNEVFAPQLQKEKKSIRWESELKLINRRKNSSLEVLATFFSIRTSRREEQSDIAIIMRDITERKAAEKKIRQSEEKYRNLVETMEEGIVLVDTEGVTLFVNDQLVQMFGYEKSEFLEQPFFEMLAPQTKENAAFFNELEKETAYFHINPDEPYKETRSELQLRKRNGELIWLWVSSNPIKDEVGNITGYISALADVTSLKQAQNEILEVNKEMEQLLYRASHDLKGPVSSVEGVINLMRLEINHEQMAFYSDMMMASIKKLLMRIKDLTKLSAIKNREISMQKIEVLPMLKDLQKTFEFAPYYNQITFEYDIEPLEFYSDESLFRTIMQNFVENGIKYADPDKSHSFLRISLRQSEAQAILITIQDNGIGIHQDFKDRIFDMFFRATESVAGTGMGLYIVNSAVKKLGGSLRFETRYREGTTFYLKLPNKKRSI